MSAAIEPEDDVSFAPRRLGHGHLFVGELDRSMRFYHDICGLEEVAREPGIGAGFLSNGNTHHDVGLIQVTAGKEIRGRDGQMQIPSGRGTAPGLNHLGWEMPNEAQLVAAYRRAEACQLPLHRLADHQISHSVYLFDPDGNLHEFYADAMRDWRGFFQGELDLLTGEWLPDDAATDQPQFDPDPEIQRVSDALSHPLRTSYAVLLTQQLHVMTDFFTQVCGLSIAHETSDRKCVGLRGIADKPGTDITLIETDEDNVGLHHFGFELLSRAEVDNATTALLDAGFTLEREVSNAGKQAVFLRDPDGLCLAFSTRTSPSFEALEEAHAARAYFA